MKCPYDHQLANKGYLSDITVAYIYQSFAHKMAAKTSGHRYMDRNYVTVTLCIHSCCFIGRTGLRIIELRPLNSVSVVLAASRSGSGSVNTPRRSSCCSRAASHARCAKMRPIATDVAWSVCLSVRLLDTTMSCTETAEPIKTPL